jgi:hypothetical protein
MNKNKKTSRSNLTVTNPGAAVIIYNYRDRLGTHNINKKNEQEVDQIIINTASLISVSTSKTKSQCAGTFEIQLAPWKNWVTAITPGSWCVILMGRTPIKSSETNGDNLKVDKRHFKMLGRIESVRCVTSVDQATGVLTTKYIVTGTDWGSIFNSFLYLDPASRTADTTSIGAAQRMLYDKIVLAYGKTDSKELQYDSTDAVRALLAFWGIEDATAVALKVETFDQILAQALNTFGMPMELARYMNFTKIGTSVLTNKVASLLRLRGGVLTDYDTYSCMDSKKDTEHADGIGIIAPDSVFGMNSMWQLMNDNCNSTLNELIVDIRFEDDNPLLTIYKRIKPFKIRSFDEMISDDFEVKDDSGANEGALKFLKQLESDYKNVRRHKITKEEILAINAGTNWRDRFNFVEINYNRQIPEEDANRIANAFKKDLQFFDRESIRRDGLLPLTMPVLYFPPDNADPSKPNIHSCIAYKYLGKEWFFDTHKMLNGVVTLIGQDNYMQVGDNIIFEANIISSNFNVNTDSLNNSNNAYILAHIETISNTATVSQNGARSFITEIQFVRGIVSDSNGVPVGNAPEQTLNQDSSDIDSSQERIDRVIGKSSGKDGSQDPDIKKMGK